MTIYYGAYAFMLDN